MEGGKDDQDWFQALEYTRQGPSIELNVAWTLVEITIDECRQLYAPWRRALVVKLLGKTVSLKVFKTHI